MQIYNYSAKEISGKVVRGTLEADNENEAYKIIKQRGQIPMKISLQSKNLLRKWGIIGSSSKVPVKEMAIFARQFATIMRAGVPIVKCLDILRRQTDNIALQESIDRLYEDVQKGLSLSRAMEKQGVVYSTLFVSMVQVGEMSGTLDNSLDKMAIQLEKDLKLRKKITGALTYPIVLAVIALIAVFVLMIFVVPQFKSIFEGNSTELPLITKLLLAVSDNVKSYWYLYISGIIAAIIGFNVFIRSTKGKEKWDVFVLKIPVVKDLQRKNITARFARVSSTMLGAGISLLNTIDAAEKVVDNRVAQDALRRIRNDVTKGGGLKGPIGKEKLFPAMLSHMVGVGEESGSLDEMLDKTASFFEDEVDSEVDKVSTLIEPVILVFMAVVVGGIVLAIMVPMFQMSSMY